jgi:hypothetical protein
VCQEIAKKLLLGRLHALAFIARVLCAWWRQSCARDLDQQGTIARYNNGSICRSTPSSAQKPASGNRLLNNPFGPGLGAFSNFFSIFNHLPTIFSLNKVLDERVGGVPLFRPKKPCPPLNSDLLRTMEMILSSWEEGANWNWSWRSI